jgi:hypothetical protein
MESRSRLQSRVVGVWVLLLIGGLGGRVAGQEGSEVGGGAATSRSPSASPAGGTEVLFAPLVAHPLEPRTFVGIAQEASESFSTQLMVMGLGDYALTSPRLSVGGGL